MPVIYRFYGIVIRMYFFQTEHNPTHIHAIYGENTAVLTIQDGKILEGYLPPKELSMVKEWIKMNKDDLTNIWNNQEFHVLKPLV